MSFKGSIPPTLATMYSAHVPLPSTDTHLFSKEFDKSLPPLFTPVPDPSTPNDNGGGPDGYLLYTFPKSLGFNAEDSI